MKCLINETMTNNKANIVNDDTTKNIFISLFSVLMFVGITCFCVFAYFKWIKGKKLFKKRFENKHFNDVSKIHDDYQITSLLCLLCLLCSFFII